MSSSDEDERKAAEAHFVRDRPRAPLPSLMPPPVDLRAASLDARETAERYRLRRTLGKGSMGEVRLCSDERIGRDVAIKVILPAHADDPQLYARFVREARVQGQLEHPSIVPVYDLGVDDEGATFFVMKRLRGLTLAEILKGLREKKADTASQFSLRRLLTAFSSVCLTIDFAHSRGVLHRDLKPANVMLGDFGEVYVLDWGLAKLTDPREQEHSILADADDIETSAGKVLGTFGYMAPEQALGNLPDIDARSDVYALGAILFEILTLAPLHPKTSWNAMLESTIKGASATPSTRTPHLDVPPELEAICVKATMRARDDRFQTARAMHDALERYLDGDRDLAVRKQLAETHARAAEEAAALAVTGGVAAEDARRTALAEVGRTLVLDPTNGSAMRTLAQVITAPPRQTPAEVIADIDELAFTRHRLQLREGIRADLTGMTLMIPFCLWMGLRSLGLLFTMVAFTLVSAGFKFAAVRWESLRGAHALAYGAYVFNLLAVVCISRGFGPLFFTPMLIAVFTVVYCMSYNARYRATIVATGGATLLLAAAAEITGLVPRSYAFADGAMTILPRAITHAEGPTLIGLTTACFFVTLVPSLVMGKLQKALAEAEERAFLHAWHLQQLLPDPSGAASVPPSSRA